MSDPSHSFAQAFYEEFQASHTDLAARIADAAQITPSQDALQDLVLRLAKMRKELTDATGSLPSYDQRRAELQLKALETDLENLRASSAPKPKFTFSRKPKNLPSGVPSSAPPSDAIRPAAPAASSAQLGTPDISPVAARSISSHRDTYIDHEFVPPSSKDTSADLTISDLAGCLVNLLADSSSSVGQMYALHISNVKDSVLLLPSVKGSVLLHDLARCVVVVGCHQFRMHNSTDVDVYLAITSNPVIEHCSRIRFSSYPAALPSIEGQEAGIPTPQDFSHIRPTPSPHWSHALADRRARMDGWLSAAVLPAVAPVGADGVKESIEKILPDRVPTPERT